MTQHDGLLHTGSIEKQWYVLQVYVGKEQEVCRIVEQRIKGTALESLFDKMLAPTEEVVAMQAGRKKRSKRKIFPGYVLLHMVANDDTVSLVRSVPHVMSFVGGGHEKPVPISEKEAQAILDRIESGADKPKPKVLFTPGEVIRVVTGPFTDFSGVIEEVNYEKSKLRVSVLIFGRSAPVELDFDQVAKT